MIGKMLLLIFQNNYIIISFLCHIVLYVVLVIHRYNVSLQLCNATK